jgi:hypothetical protein
LIHIITCAGVFSKKNLLMWDSPHDNCLAQSYCSDISFKDASIVV